LKKKSQQSRIYIRLYGLMLLGVLSLATAVTPVRAMALQQTELPSHPTVQTPAQEGQHPPKTEAAKSEEHENDEYRHAPVVQSLARMLHMDVETAARTFEIFNVALIVLGIGIPLVRVMPRMLRGRSQKIRADIEAAQKTTQDANARLSAVEAKLASLDQEIAKFRTEIEQQIGQDEQRGKAALEEETARIVASAEQEISVAAAQAKSSLRHFAADLAIEKAVKQLVLTPETDRALIAEFVAEASRNNKASGGKH
jgi:F-type H+-transporting ATPase subunit b